MQRSNFPRVWASALVVGTLGTVPLFAGEKARITAPDRPPQQEFSRSKKPDAPSLPFRSLKSGDSTGAVVDAPALPTVPPLDPTTERQLMDRLDRDKNWLLDERLLDSPDPAAALQEQWDLGEGASRDTKSLLHRRLLGTEDVSREAQTKDDSRLTSRDPDKGPRRGAQSQTDDWLDEDDYDRPAANKKAGYDGANLFELTGNQSYNPFQAVKSEFRAGDIFSGEVSDTKLGGGFNGIDQGYGKDWQQRVERYGTVFGGGDASSTLELRTGQLGQERQSRVQQFDQATMSPDLKALEPDRGGIGAGNFTPPSRTPSAFESLAPGNIIPFAAPAAAAPVSRAFEAISAPVPAIQPLPKPTF